MTAEPAQIPERPPPRELSQLAGHVVICNCNPKVRTVVNELMRITAPSPLDVVLLVQDEPLWRAHPEWHPDPAHAAHFFPLFGNPADPAFLERSRMAHARTAMILADPNQAELADARSTLVAVAIEHHSPQVHTVIELVSTLNRPHLASTEVDEVVCGDDIAQKLLAQSCITPGVVNIFRRLLRLEKESARLQHLELPEGLAGRSYRELSRTALARRAPFVLVGFSRPDPGTLRVGCADFTLNRRLVLNPQAGGELGRDAPLAEGDKLLVLGRESEEIGRWLV